MSPGGAIPTTRRLSGKGDPTRTYGLSTGVNATSSPSKRDALAAEDAALEPDAGALRDLEAEPPPEDLDLGGLGRTAGQELQPEGARLHRRGDGTVDLKQGLTLKGPQALHGERHLSRGAPLGLHRGRRAVSARAGEVSVPRGLCRGFLAGCDLGALGGRLLGTGRPKDGPAEQRQRGEEQRGGENPENGPHRPIVAQWGGHVDRGSSGDLSKCLAAEFGEALHDGGIAELTSPIELGALRVDLRSPAEEEVHDRKQLRLVVGPDLEAAVLEPEVGPRGDRRAQERSGRTPSA